MGWVNIAMVVNKLSTGCQQQVVFAYLRFLQPGSRMLNYCLSKWYV